MRLFFIIWLFPMLAFCQPMQRNFFTTNTAPQVTVTAGSNVFVTASTPSSQVRDYKIDVPASSTGTVTSVAITGPAGVSWANSPITGAGILTGTTPGLLHTNGNSFAANFSNSVAIDVTHALSLSNATVSRVLMLNSDNTVTNVPASGAVPINADGTQAALPTAFPNALTNFDTRQVSFRTSLEQTNVTSTESVFISNAVVTVIHTNLALQSTSFGLNITNSNQAALNTQISSPGIAMYGNGWKTASTAGSQTVGFRQYVLPVQGSSSPSATWQLDSSINGGAFANALTYSSGGALTTAGGVTLSGTGGITTSDDINSGGSIKALSSGFIYWNSRSRMESTVDGNITLHNAANTAFTALILGPISNTWPTFVTYTNALGANIDSTINHKVKSLIISSNALSSWPTAPIAPGDTAFVSSNGVVYALYSGVAATWVKTNLISGP